ncbi:hypothetical protein X971_4173 [Agrobacterium tumefaciens LBA4213 (Ach5)]|nr:hypothetical protein X971_4173 [Agrobacterium tumefaciens LBA4213 (Ach5)]
MQQEPVNRSVYAPFGQAFLAGRMGEKTKSIGAIALVF